MASHAHNKPLSERLVNYPEAAPQDTIELINTDVEAILALGLDESGKSAVLEHRRDVLDAIFSYEKKPITSPEAALELLSGKRPLLRPLGRKWLFYVLNERRERKLVPHPNGEDMTYLSVVTRKVPTAEKLRNDAPLPKGGKYLGIYGGGPDILGVTTVAKEVAALFEELPVADVLFWHLETGKAPALYSLAKGQGDRGGELVEFPDQKALETARKPLEKVRNA